MAVRSALQLDQDLVQRKASLMAVLLAQSWVELKVPLTVN